MSLTKRGGKGRGEGRRREGEDERRSEGVTERKICVCIYVCVGGWGGSLGGRTADVFITSNLQD